MDDENYDDKLLGCKTCDHSKYSCEEKPSMTVPRIVWVNHCKRSVPEEFVVQQKDVKMRDETPDVWKSIRVVSMYDNFDRNVKKK